MTEPIKESFEWMTPEFKILDVGKDTIRIKGVAMKGDAISRNQRKYVDEELKKAARTWVGKPVTVNHDPSKKVGDVKWMEYSDQSDALEYMADINKQPYVDMIRNKSTAIRGVSIEAAYLHNRCPKCDKRFYTEEEFHSHMHHEHFIKTNPTLEPHGIFGQALSLVLSPEEPGYADTTVELMETYTKPLSRLLETVAKTYQEKEEYMEKLQGKAAIRPESRQVYDKQVREQKAKEEVKPVAEPVKEDKPATVETPKVEPVTPTQTPQKEPVIVLAATENDRANIRKILNTDARVAGQPKTEDAKPIAVNLLYTPGEMPKMKETVSPTFATVKLPDDPVLPPAIAEYGSFEACLASGKSHEECAAIMKSCSQETEVRKTIAEYIGVFCDILGVVNTNVQTAYAHMQERHNNLVECVKALPPDDLGWKQAITELAAAIPADDTTWKEVLANIPKDDMSWKDKLATLEMEGKKLAETMTATTTKFEKLLEIADKNNVEVSKTLEEREKELKEIKEKLEEQKTVKETLKNDLTTRMDNLEAKVKPKFEGKAVKPTQQPNDEYYEDPLKQKPKKGN